MEKDKVFRPKGLDRNFFRQGGLIAGGFFVVVQVVFMDGMADRLIFTAFFALFVLGGVWLYFRHGKDWPQEIRLSAQGIGYTDLRSRHGIDRVPWNEIEKIDLFHNKRSNGIFLVIALREGPFRESLKVANGLKLSLGRDINIPVAVDADSGTVLETARSFWEQNRT